MEVFKKYSNYYDNFYKDKDYNKEVEFLQEVIKRYSSIKVEDILSLGCGTVSHEVILAKNGFRITGIDKSETMLKIAQEKAKGLPIEVKLADNRNFRTDKKFDLAMAMFNVIGYQTKNIDMEKTLQNVSNSLKKNGLFVFDCWHRSAVLKDRPLDKTKKIGEITRVTRQKLDIQNNTIDINFEIIDKGNKVLEENHKMRFWLLPELEHFLSKTGFKLLKACNFLDLESEVSEDIWNIFIIAEKI